MSQSSFINIQKETHISFFLLDLHSDLQFKARCGNEGGSGIVSEKPLYLVDLCKEFNSLTVLLLVCCRGWGQEARKQSKRSSEAAPNRVQAIISSILGQVNLPRQRLNVYGEKVNKKDIRKHGRKSAKPQRFFLVQMLNDQYAMCVRGK